MSWVAHHIRLLLAGHTPLQAACKRCSLYIQTVPGPPCWPHIARQADRPGIHSRRHGRQPCHEVLCLQLKKKYTLPSKGTLSERFCVFFQGLSTHCPDHRQPFTQSCPLQQVPCPPPPAAQHQHVWQCQAQNTNLAAILYQGACSAHPAPAVGPADMQPVIVSPSSAAAGTRCHTSASPPRPVPPRTHQLSMPGLWILILESEVEGYPPTTG